MILLILSKLAKRGINCSLQGNLDPGAQSLFTTNNNGVASCASII